MFRCTWTILTKSQIQSCLLHDMGEDLVRKSLRQDGCDIGKLPGHGSTDRGRVEDMIMILSKADLIFSVACLREDSPLFITGEAMPDEPSVHDSNQVQIEMHSFSLTCHADSQSPSASEYRRWPDFFECPGIGEAVETVTRQVGYQVLSNIFSGLISVCRGSLARWTCLRRPTLSMPRSL